MFFDGIWLSAMSIWDIRFRRVPLWMIGLGVPAAVASLAFGGTGGNLEIAEFPLFMMPGVILLLAAVTKKAGYGDGLVLILLGLIDRENNGMEIFLMSLICMSMFAVVMIVLRKAGRGTRLPYLPFLLVAWFLGRLVL